MLLSSSFIFLMYFLIPFFWLPLSHLDWIWFTFLYGHWSFSLIKYWNLHLAFIYFIILRANIWRVVAFWIRWLALIFHVLVLTFVHQLVWLILPLLFLGFLWAAYSWGCNLHYDSKTKTKDNLFLHEASASPLSAGKLHIKSCVWLDCFTHVFSFFLCNFPLLYDQFCKFLNIFFFLFKNTFYYF